MDSSLLFAQRESCRSFRLEPLATQVISEILEAARLAPSSRNRQPWRFVVVEDAATRQALVPCLQSQKQPINRFAGEAQAFVVIVEDREGMAPMVDDEIEHQDFTLLDIGLATANLCLAATAKGVGSCIIGWFHQDKIRELLHIPAEKEIRLVVALGYPQNPTPRAKTRKPLAQLVSYNQWLGVKNKQGIRS